MIVCRYNFTPTEKEKELVLNKLGNNLKIPLNFKATAAPYQLGDNIRGNTQPEAKLNPQTLQLCEALSINDPLCLLAEALGINLTLDSVCLDSSIEDTDEQSTIDSQISRKENLQLPDPVNDLAGVSKNIWIEESQEDPDISVPIHADEASDLSPKKEAMTGESNFEVESSTLDSPGGPKKFKRRNASIYDTSDS